MGFHDAGLMLFAPFLGSAVIPASYTKSDYPLQYYFETGKGLLYPGLPRDFAHAPYFTIAQA